MGGFGAMRLGLKYPDLFSSIVAFAGGYRWPEEIEGAHFSWKEMFNNDAEIFRANHPETWARRNLDQHSRQDGDSDVRRRSGSRA